MLRLLAGAFLLLPLLATNAQATIRVAVLCSHGDEQGENVAALLDTQLGHLNSVTVLNRDAIDRVLKEQRLQAMFSAEATGKRALLGKLLKADLLIMLHFERDPTPHVDVVVCETDHGLRLCASRIAGSDVEAHTAAVFKLVKQAITKYQQKITETVAVPPFVSTDLSTEFQSLQRPYALLVEQMLLDRPGVLVVELAEAKALAGELALTSAKDIERRLPLYLLGTFRHKGLSPNTRVTVDLVLMRGQNRLDERQLKDVTPGEVAAMLRREGAAMIDKAMGTAVSLPDPATEADQLGKRAELMCRLGSWMEAVELAEASLLLKPGQASLHRLAADSLCLRATYLRNLAHDSAAQNAKTPQEAWNQSMHDCQPLFLRGLPHLEQFLRTGRVSMGLDFGLIASYLNCCEAKKEMQEMMLHAFKAKYDAGILDDDTALFCPHCQQWCFSGASKAESMRWRLEAAKVFPRRPDADGQIRLICMLTENHLEGVREKLPEMIKALRTFSNPLCRPVADTLERRMKAGGSLLSDGPGIVIRPKPPRTRPQNPEVLLDRITLKSPVVDWIPANPAIDVLWSERELFLLQGKELASPKVVAPIHAESSGSSVCFDGQYVWAFQNPADVPAKKRNKGKGKQEKSKGNQQEGSGQPRILVLDATTGQSWPITPADGLPPMALIHFSVTPLAPGKVCAVGIFGQWNLSRAWIAMVQFDPKTGKGVVKVFHEALDTATSGHGDGWKNVHESFIFTHAYTITEPVSDNRKPRQRVIIDRRSWHPLLIDPETLSVEAIPEDYRRATSTRAIVHKGTLYWVGPSGNEFRVWRLGFPDLKIRPCQHVVPPGQLGVWNDQVGLTENDTQLWIAPNPEASFRKVATDCPYPESEKHFFQGISMFSSHHYGMVMHDIIGNAYFRIQ